MANRSAYMPEMNALPGLSNAQVFSQQQFGTFEQQGTFSAGFGAQPSNSGANLATAIERPGARFGNGTQGNLQEHANHPASIHFLDATPF